MQKWHTQKNKEKFHVTLSWLFFLKGWKLLLKLANSQVLKVAINTLQVKKKKKKKKNRLLALGWLGFGFVALKKTVSLTLGWELLMLVWSSS
jgi:hypothetical protein